MSSKTPGAAALTSVRRPSAQADLRQRAEKLLATPITFIASDRFHLASAPPAGSLPAVVEAGEPMDQPAGEPGLPPHLKQLCATPLLSPEDEQTLFFRMNYCKYHAAAIQSTLSPARPVSDKMDEAEEYLERAQRIRNYLLRANIRLVMSIARKFADARNPFDDLLSCGITSLLRAVEKFDSDRGYRFSTYATCAVRRDLNRLVMTRRRDSQRFPAAPGEMLDTLPESPSTSPERAVDRWRSLSSLLNGMMENLDERERQIIKARFGFDEQGKKTSFSHLGKRMGISKERARQLANRALDKLRAHDQAERLELFCS